MSNDPCNEALDALWELIDQFDEYRIKHSAALTDRLTKAKASEVGRKLDDLYGLIGKKACKP